MKIYHNPRIILILGVLGVTSSSFIIKLSNQPAYILAFSRVFLTGIIAYFLLNKNFEPIELVASESLPENLKVQNLNILPEKISLTSPLDYAQILVTADLGNGRESDVTRMVKWSIPQKIGNIDNRGLFTPVQDGKAAIKATTFSSSASTLDKQSA